MVKKLRIKESVNKMSDEVYDNIALLGYACTLASNDFHHIHLCAIGDKFQEIHESADEYLSKVRELNDFCLELAKEGGLETYNETFAHDVIKDSGNDWKVAEDKEYDFVKAFTEMSNILTDLSQFIMIIEEMEGVTSDVTSVLDEYLRDFTKAVNYFIDKKLSGTEEILVGQTESIRRNRKRLTKESIYGKTFTGSTWKELIKNIEANSTYKVDSSEKDMVGSKHNNILLHGKKGLFLATVTKTNDGFIVKEVDIKPMKESMKRTCNESYKDSKAYKKLAEYDYICEVDGNTVTIKWADDGAVYAKFTLTSPEEMFADTDTDPYDDFGRAHGYDCWIIDDGNGLMDTDATTYDDAVVAAINYFWNHY
jgi:DNA-binding ferritin-like protein